MKCPKSSRIYLDTVSEYMMQGKASNIQKTTFYGHVREPPDHTFTDMSVNSRCY